MGCLQGRIKETRLSSSCEVLGFRTFMRCALRRTLEFCGTYAPEISASSVLCCLPALLLCLKLYMHIILHDLRLAPKHRPCFNHKLDSKAHICICCKTNRRMCVFSHFCSSLQSKQINDFLQACFALVLLVPSSPVLTPSKNQFKASLSRRASFFSALSHINLSFITTKGPYAFFFLGLMAYMQSTELLL